jgi:translocator protein
VSSIAVRRGRLWKPVVIAALAATALGALGALVTDLSSWYYMLRKPSWQPPDWLFGPAWTAIFGLAAMAGVLAWRNAPTAHARGRIVILFVVNSALNVAWSWLFFRLHRPDWALYEVGFLWLSIVALIVALWPLSRTAAALLLPYLVWVTFASVLNLAVVRLNQPFA